MTSATEGQGAVFTLLRNVCRLALAQQQQLTALCTGNEAQIQLAASASLASSLAVQQVWVFFKKSGPLFDEINLRCA